MITTAANQPAAENTTIVAALTSTDADTVGTNPAEKPCRSVVDAEQGHVCSPEESMPRENGFEAIHCRTGSFQNTAQEAVEVSLKRIALELARDQ